MASMFSLYKEIHPATGIEHCIKCHFFDKRQVNLVIAGANQMHVYRLNSDINVTEKITENGEKSETVRTRLECLKRFSLFGNITSMQCVSLAGAKRDVLLLSFTDAKLSVVEYDPSLHDLRTVSLHKFEEAELRGGLSNNTHDPLVHVDPDGRCAAMLVYGRHLVVLPFNKDVSESVPIISSYVIDLSNLDDKIINILDFQFLHGYYEPTVFILYEPLATWSGRTAMRTDTCCIVAISINIQQRVHPVIWSQADLPFDCFLSIAVPKPTGGVLVFATNSLLYLNQSVPPYGVSLNSIAEQSSCFPLRPQEGIKVTLDCVQVALVDSERCVLSLKGGELYVLTLVVDGMRCVRGFHFDKAASCVLTSCMCVIPDGFLFLGSRLGNSMLLHYQEKSSGTVLEPDSDRRSSGPPIKRRRVEGLEQLASDVTEIENQDELEVYGDGHGAGGTALTSYVFEVCDTIWNIAPCTNAVAGEPAFLSEEYSNDFDPDLELVTTSGFGKNGAISVLQRSIRPQVVTTFQLDDCHDMWTVFGPPVNTYVPCGEDVSEGSGKISVSQDSTCRHAFLVLSRQESTMVLQTGEEINELDHSGFLTLTRTVCVANLGDNRYIIQVSPSAVQLLVGVTQLQHLPIDIGSPIERCSVSDPYVLLTSEMGQVAMMTLTLTDTYSTGVRLSVFKPPIAQTPKIIEAVVFADTSGMFTTVSTTAVTDRHPQDYAEPVESQSVPRAHCDTDSCVDDEDEMLYGETSNSLFGKPATTTQSERPPETTSQLFGSNRGVMKPTYWGFIARENGDVEIYSLPSFTLCYCAKGFTLGPKVVVDCQVSSCREGSSNNSDIDPPAPTALRNSTLGGTPQLRELLLAGLGYNKSRPYLLALVDDELLIYEAFPYQASDQRQTDERLLVRFRKLEHGLVLRERPCRHHSGRDAERMERGTAFGRTRMMRYFSDVSGYSGVFICGLYPHWLFMTSKGALRIHPMSIDGWVRSFSPFSNVNCPNGFLYFNKQSELRVCVLPTHVTYDAPWPIRKVPLRCTPHFLCYHPDSKLYAVAISIPEDTNKLPKPHTEERDWEAVERGDRFVLPQLLKFSVYLFTPSTWEMVPEASCVCEEWEHITALKNVQLTSEGTLSGLKGYIAVSTTYCLGEDVCARGRVIILDVIEVVPKPGQPLTKHKVKVVYDKEQKGPVSALSHINGFLLTAVGQKLYIWQLKDNDLSGVAFIDTHIYIHSLITLKNLILVGDILKSITLYRYQSDLKVLSVVSKDLKPMEVFAVEFMVDNSQLAFVASDRNKNVFIFSYNPEVPESNGGQRLLRRADFNVGSHINTMLRVRCRAWDRARGEQYGEVTVRRHVTFFATLDGGLGYLLPIPEKVYRRLLMMQNALVAHIPHTAGLNPRAFRTVKSTVPELDNPHRLILDAELIWKFLHLSHTERGELARRLGTSVDQIIDDLVHVDRITAHF